MQYGKNKQGRYNERHFECSNGFAFVKQTYEVPAQYSTDTSTIIHVDIKSDDIDEEWTETNANDVNATEVKEKKEHHIIANYCNGELQEMEFKGEVIRPNASQEKYKSLCSKLSLRLAFYKAAKNLLIMNHLHDFSELGNIEWEVVTLLPPGHLDAGRQPLTDMVQEIDKVEVVYPEVTIPIKIKSVLVLPEGFCAYVAVVFDKGKVFRPENKFLTSETVFVFDIGAGTTDCLLIKGNKLIQQSKFTIRQGGNNVVSLVKGNLNGQGLDLDASDIEEGMNRGYVKDGIRKVDIIPIINEAKQTVAAKIISAFQSFIDQTDTKMRSIGYVLVCGGGSVQPSTTDEIRPLSEFVLKSVRQYTPNAGLV